MCGSGTLPIEAALMAGDCAPGLTRDYFGFLGWRQHDAALWTALIEEARERRCAGLNSLSPIVGYDSDACNVAQAGLAVHVRIGHHALANCAKSVHADRGLLVINPPYG